MLCRLLSPRRLILSLILCGVFLSSSSRLPVVSAEETSSSTLSSSHVSTSAAAPPPGDERYQRRETWDLFGFIMMMVSSDCGPAAKIRIGDHSLCRQCNNGNGSSCQSLCDMSYSDDHKSHYSRYCGDSGTETQTQYSYNEDSNNADAYIGNSETGSVATGENYSKGFQLWMVATAAAVGMALVAIHIGQRKERENPDEIADDESSVGANVTGSVGRRLSAISAFADGVMPTNKQVELAEYQLESDTPQASPPSYPQSQFV